jgi:polysaccharide pyruvyl transferase WcaK-like protein
VGRVLGIKIKDTVHEKVQIWDYLVAWMALLNERLTRTSVGRRVVFSIPRPMLKLSLYTMKLLESIARDAGVTEERPIVGIIGGTIWGNRGAESMLVTTIGQVREAFPNAMFKVFSYFPKRDRQLVQRPDIDILSCTPASLLLRVFPFALLQWALAKLRIRIPGKLLTRVVREMRQCTVMLDVGGISFVDGREFYLPFNILAIWPAMLLGIPVVKMAQALGPFRNPINRVAARLFLPHCEHVFARGQATFEHLQDLGLRNASQVTDIAFLYQPDYSLSNENEERVSGLETSLKDLRMGGQRLIGLAPSTVMWERHGDRYIDELVTLVRELSAGDTHFVFLANATREGSVGPRNNDLSVLKILELRLRSTLAAGDFARTHWALWDVNTRSLRRLIALLDLLITSRFHAMVSALSLRVPVLVIGWSHKYVETLQHFGLQQYAANFDDPGTDLAAMAREILRDAETVRRQIGRALVAVQDSAAGQFAHVTRLLQRITAGARRMNRPTSTALSPTRHN